MAHSNVGSNLEERQEKINAACALLIQEGFSRELFTIKTIHDHGYTDDEFLEYIKPLTSITDWITLSALSSQAGLSLSWTSKSCDSFIKFIDFIEWLNGEEGKKAMAHSAFLKHYSTKKNFVKSTIHAYKLYEEDCRSKELDAIPKHHEMGFEKAVESFGGIAKERHLVNYLNDPDRIEKIRDHFRHKILRLEYAGDSFGKSVFYGENCKYRSAKFQESTKWKATSTTVAAW